MQVTDVEITEINVKVVFCSSILLMTFCCNLRMASGMNFYVAGFPSVIGCIDGTHIPAPSLNKVDYVNRNSFHSINVQIWTTVLTIANYMSQYNATNNLCY